MKKLGMLMPFLLIAFMAQAADITMTADDTFGQASFNTGLHWPGGLAPSAGNNYFTGDFTLRTPGDAGSYTFAGDSLTVNNTSAYPDGLFYKGTGTPSTLTINNLILNGGIISHGNGPTHICRFEGNISVIADSQIWAKQGPIDIYSVISGSGTITNPSSDSASCVLTFNSSASTFTGSIVNNGRFTLADNAVLNFVIGADGVNNSVSGTGPATVFNGDFNIDLTGSGTGLASSWAIVSASNVTYGATFTVTGFTDDGDGLWSTSANGVTYQFDESTGILSVYTPELNEDPIGGLLFDTEYPVLNGDLTLPGVIVNPGWDGESGPDIPGWTAIAPGTTDGGTGGGGTGDSADGDGWHAAVRSIDPDVYNIADANMVEGVTYTFTGQFAPRWGLIEGEMSVVADDDPNILLATAPITFPQGVDHSATFYPAAVSYTATASDAGKKIGVYLGASGDTGWLRFDDVHLYTAYLELHGVIDQAPEGSDVDPQTLTQLSWTPTNDPNLDGIGIDDQILYYYIANGDGSNPDYSTYLTQSGNSAGIAATSYALPPVGYDQYGLWRVDTVMNGVTYTGRTVLFTTQTADEVPVVTAGSGWLTYLGGTMPSLSATVDDWGEGDVDLSGIAWSVDLPWDPTNPAAMQMIARTGDPDLAELETAGYDPNLLVDWIGADIRGGLWIFDPFVLTLSNVPAGTYNLTTYHHDPVDQTDIIEVTVVDGSGTSAPTTVDITDSNDVPIGTFTASATPDLSGNIKLIFDDTQTSFIVVNGLVLSDGVNPDLKIDFSLAGGPVGVGYQAYTAFHENASTFTTQTFSALGGTIGVTPAWGPGEAYGATAAVTDTSSDPLAPTASFNATYQGDYTVTIAVTDIGGSQGPQEGLDTLLVRVAPDACTGAAVWGGTAYNTFDSDNDCDVDIVDFAAFAAQWLDDISLTGPVAE